MLEYLWRLLGYTTNKIEKVLLVEPANDQKELKKSDSEWNIIVPEKSDDIDTNCNDKCESKRDDPPLIDFSESIETQKSEPILNNLCPLFCDFWTNNDAPEIQNEHAKDLPKTYKIMIPSKKFNKKWNKHKKD